MKFLTRTGRTVNLPNSDLISVLQDIGAITPFVEVPIQRKAVLTWEICQSTGDVPYAFILGNCSGCGNKMPVLNVPEKVQWNHCGQDPNVPKNICDRFYALQKEQAQS
jgi:hypothetical protein